MKVDPVALTQQLVRFDTINPTSPERDCARFLAELLENGGFRVRLHEFAPGRASLVAAMPGGSRPPLCFAGHLDTVPLGAAPWTRNPFAGETDAGRLYGRGSSDMKSGVAALACAALDLAREGQLRDGGLTLVFVAGEETGCEGAAHLARTAGALGTAAALVVGEPTGGRPLVGHKGALWLEARTRGVTAHGSMPERGVNAVYSAARAVSALEAFQFDVPPDPLLGRPTLNVGMIRGGLNINSVPDEAVIGIDIRTVPAQQHARVREDLARVLGPEVELRARVDVPGVRTEENDPFVQKVYQLVEQRSGGRPTAASAPYFTDASILTPAFGGIPTVILGPGELVQAHQTDEYAEVLCIEETTELYRELGRRWCGA
ncbi:MAG TPA: M20 family metallopeptidase [Myxococcaceae bacterium]|nr:M20 family metallopeptidase [Myxococcaceae bacterium]